MFLSSASNRLMLHDLNWNLKLCHGNYNDTIKDISWSDDGKYLLQVNPKGLVEILSTTDTEVRSLQHVPLKETWVATFHRDGHRNVAVGSKSGQVLIWDTKFKSVCKTFPTPAQQCPVNFISYNVKNTNLAASMQNGDTIIYGVTSNSAVLTVKVARSKSISAMKFHPDARALLGLATDEGHILLRDITSNKDKVYFKNVHTSPVSDFTFSLINRDVLLSSGYDKIMHVYDIRLEHVVSTIKTQYPLTSVTINSDNQVALGSRKGVILVYDLRDFATPLMVINDHSEEVKRVSFQPLKKKLLTNESSLKEDNHVNVLPKKVISPDAAKREDLILMYNSPQRGQSQHDTITQQESVPNKADSFLFMMGLDKTNNLEFDDACDSSKAVDSPMSEKKNELIELKIKQLESEKKHTKSSTPIINKTVDNFGCLSPLYAANYTETIDNDYKRVDSPLLQSNKQGYERPEAQLVAGNNIDEGAVQKISEELKDVVKLFMADIAEDSRLNSLQVMMCLTKQKIFLEKQLFGIVQQVQSMQRTQDNLLEENKRLVMEVELLKSAKNLPT